MSINSENDWKVVELRAQLAEAGQIHCEPVPLTICGENWITKHQYDSVAQQLLWTAQRCAELQAKIHRMRGLMGEAHMWLSVNATERAMEALNKGILDL